jgi:hypothetical protein
MPRRFHPVSPAFDRHRKSPPRMLRARKLAEDDAEEGLEDWMAASGDAGVSH